MLNTVTASAKTKCPATCFIGMTPISRLKKTAWILFAVLTLLIIFFQFILKPLVETKLDAGLKEVLKDKYTFKYEKMELSLLAGNIRLYKASLTPGRQMTPGRNAPANAFSIKVEYFDLEGISYLGLLNKKIKISLLSFHMPTIELLQGKKTEGKKTFDLKDFLKKSKGIYISEIQVHEGTVLVRSVDTSTILLLKRFEATLSDLNFDSTIASDNDGLPKWKHLKIGSSFSAEKKSNNAQLFQISQWTWSDADSVLQLSKVHFSQTSTNGQQKTDLLLPLLRIEKTNLHALILGKIKISRIIIASPQLQYTLGMEHKTQARPDLEGGLRQVFPDVEIGELKVVNGTVSINNIKEQYNIHLSQIDHSYKNINLNDSTSLRESSYIASAAFSSKSFKVVLSDSLYVLQGGAITVDTIRNEVVFNHVELLPQYSEHVFFKKQGKQTDRITLTCPLIRVKGLDFQGLVFEKSIIAKEIYIPEMNIKTVRDKRFPPPHKYKRLPAPSLMGANKYIKIDLVKVDKADITYQEIVPGAPGKSTLRLTKLAASISNITNDRKASLSPMVVKTSFYIYGKSHLRGNISFNLKSKEGQFTASGTSTGMDIQHMNELLENSVFISVKEGTVDSLNFNFTGNDTLSQGKMDFYYHDLKVDMINKKTGNISKIGSFIIDKLILKSDNPGRNEKVRAGKIHFERDRNKSVFNFLAKSLLSGIVSSIAPAVSE